MTPDLGVSCTAHQVFRNLYTMTGNIDVGVTEERRRRVFVGDVPEETFVPPLASWVRLIFISFSR